MSGNSTLKARREEASKIIDEINEVSQNADTIYKSIKSLLTEATLDKRNIDRNNKTLQDLINKSDKLIDAYRKERDRIKVITRQIDKFNNKSFYPLMDKINDPETGFKRKIKDSDLLYKEISKITDNANNQLERLKNLVDEYKSKINSLRTLERSIEKLHNEAKLYGNNISSINKLADEIQVQISSKKESIVQSEQEVSLLEKQVITDSSTISSILEKIKSYEIEANETLVKIKKVYEIASNTGLGGAFDARKKEYEKEYKKWQKYVLGSTIALAVIVITLYIVHLCQFWGKTPEYNADFYIRFLLTSPLIYYLTFCASQHNKAKKNHEKYSLRTTVALSIESHLELLANNPQYSEKDNIDKILDFILNTFNNLYKETLTSEKKEKKEKIEKDYIDDKFEMILELLKEINSLKNPI